jgi:hypothetical protein
MSNPRKTGWPAVLGAEQPPLDRWWFGATAEEELEHRRGLVEAAERASRRERNYDQPWWAANVKALLEYIALLEEALASRVAAAGEEEG